MLGTRNSKRLGILRDKANILIPIEVRTDQSMLSRKKCDLKCPMNLRKVNKKNNGKNVSKENQTRQRKVISKNSTTQNTDTFKQTNLFENVEKPVASNLGKTEVKTDQSVLSRKKCDSKCTMNLRRANKENNDKNILRENQVEQRKVISKNSTSLNSQSTDTLKQTAVLEKVEKPATNNLGKAEIKTGQSVSSHKKSDFKCTMNLHSVNEENEEDVFVENKAGKRKVISQDSTSLKSKGADNLKQTVLCKREEKLATSNLLKAVKQNVPSKRSKRATKASQESLKENINSNMIKPNTDIKITNFFPSQALSNSKNVHSNQSILTDCSENANLNRIPVYKKVAILSELDMGGRKRSRVSDIYDINRDEDMIMEICAMEKEPKRAVRTTKASKPKVLSKKMSACRFDRRNKAQLVKEKKLVTKTTAAKPDKIPCIIVVDDAHIAEITTAAQDVQKERVQQVQPSHEDNFNALVNEINNSDPASSIEDVAVKSSNEHATIRNDDNKKLASKENTNLNVVPSLCTDDRRKLVDVIALTPVKRVNNRDINTKKGIKNVQGLIDEFEASFQMPHLTSTPDNGNHTSPIKKQVTGKNNFAVRMLEISSIPPITPVVEQFYLSDSELSPEKTDSNALEITLFESPFKADEKKKVAEKKVRQERYHQQHHYLTFLAEKKVHGKAIQTKLHFADCEKAATPQESEREIPSPLKESDAHFLSPVHTDVNQETTELIQSVSPDQNKRVTRRKRACVISKENETESDVTDESNFDTDDIFLFDSPEIDAFPKRKRKADRVDKEACTSPVKFLKVLKPRKSYHSPTQVKRWFSRTRKVGSPPQKEFQTKDDKLIQSMNEHFSELDSLELCIE